MDRTERISKADQFAITAYGVEVGKISKEFEQKLVQVRAEMGRRGLIQSGSMVHETARIRGEQCTALLQARLNCLLEGYDLHGVELDDDLVTKTMSEITAQRNTMIAQGSSHDTAAASGVSFNPTLYIQLFEQFIGMAQNEVKTQIERRRLMPKKSHEQTVTNIYHLQGPNPRVVTGGSDNSVNIVVTSSEQIFTDLRQAIESGVPAKDTRKEILEKLTALEQAQNSPSFAQRYTEFIAATADYVTLLTPFIPALAELLQRSLAR